MRRRSGRVRYGDSSRSCRRLGPHLAEAGALLVHRVHGHREREAALHVGHAGERGPVREGVDALDREDEVVGRVEGAAGDGIVAREQAPVAEPEAVEADVGRGGADADVLAGREGGRGGEGVVDAELEPGLVEAHDALDPRRHRARDLGRLRGGHAAEARERADRVHERARRALAGHGVEADEDAQVAAPVRGRAGEAVVEVDQAVEVRLAQLAELRGAGDGALLAARGADEAVQDGVELAPELAARLDVHLREADDEVVLVGLDREARRRGLEGAGGRGGPDAVVRHGGPAEVRGLAPEDVDEIHGGHSTTGAGGRGRQMASGGARRWRRRCSRRIVVHSVACALGDAPLKSVANNLATRRRTRQRDRMAKSSRSTDALRLLDAHWTAFQAASPFAALTKHPVPCDTRAWSQILVSLLTGAEGLKRKKGADFVDGSDVKAACVWEAIDKPRFNGVLPAGRAKQAKDVTSLDGTPHLFFVLWDHHKSSGQARCRVWVVRARSDRVFRAVCAKWYHGRADRSIRSENFQLHPPIDDDNNVIRNSYGNLSFPLLFEARRGDKGYECALFRPEVLDDGVCKNA